MSANDIQVDGSHYTTMKMQPWDFVVDNGLGYLEGSVVKYISRWRRKNGKVDLQKALHFCDKLIECAKEGRATPRGFAANTDIADYATDNKLSLREYVVVQHISQWKIGQNGALVSARARIQEIIKHECVA